MTKRVILYPDSYTIVFSNAVSYIGEKRIIFSFHILFIFSNVLICFKNISLIFLTKILFRFVFTTSPANRIWYSFHFFSSYHMLYLLQPIGMLQKRPSNYKFSAVNHSKYGIKSTFHNCPDKMEYCIVYHYNLFVRHCT